MKVTSKLQVTVPRSIADRYGIRPGSDIEWLAAGDSIRVVPAARPVSAETRESRLRLFDQATARHAKSPAGKAPRGRGWTREDLYRRGRAD
jgi:bifunctional DNA-binding transcriptional regulator/antitoxin component of YhaV-PrlF toxin-antitoxin module